MNNYMNLYSALKHFPVAVRSFTIDQYLTHDPQTELFYRYSSQLKRINDDFLISFSHIKTSLII